MKDFEIIIKALKAEAQGKPNWRIHLGKESFTYAEFVVMLERNTPQKEKKKFVEAFLRVAQKKFKENPAYRAKMLKLAGVAT